MTHVATNTMRRLIYFLQFHQGCRMAPGTVTITLQRNESVVDILVSLGEPGRGVRLPRPAFEAHLGGQCATWAEHAAQTPSQGVSSPPRAGGGEETPWDGVWAACSAHVAH